MILPLVQTFFTLVHVSTQENHEHDMVHSMSGKGIFVNTRKYILNQTSFNSH